jgi:hypothetical protein
MAAGVAHAGYTATGSSGEVNTLAIFRNLFGPGMTGAEWCGAVYTDGTITATRVEDYEDPCSKPGNPGDNLYLLSTSLTPTATDQIWMDGQATTTARARYAGLQQQFGYDAGSGYVEILDIGDSNGFINIPADPVTFGPDSNWRWIRKGSGTTWYSTEDDNSDDTDHLTTYYITGLNDGKITWVLFWDDQAGGGDRDFNDFVLVITAVPIVPNIVGLSQADANAAITAVDNLTVGTVTYEYSDAVADGNVISQDPAAGTLVPIGSSVDLLVSKGTLIPETYIWTNAYTWSMLWSSAQNWDPVGVPSVGDRVIISPQYVDPLAPAVEVGQGPVIDSNTTVGRIDGPKDDSDDDQTLRILDGVVVVERGSGQNGRITMCNSGSGTGTLIITGNADVTTEGDFRGIEEGSGVIDISGSATVDIGSDDEGWRIGGGDTVEMTVNIGENATVYTQDLLWLEDDDSEANATVDIGGNAAVDIDGCFRGFRGGTDATINISDDAYIHGGGEWRLPYGDGDLLTLSIDANAVVELDNQLRLGDGDEAVLNVRENAVLDIANELRMSDGDGSYSTVNLHGGSVSSDDLFIGDEGSGEINIFGGSLSTGWMGIPASGGTGVLAICDGNINCAELIMPVGEGSATLSITGGLITVGGTFGIGTGSGTLAYMDGGLLDTTDFDHEDNYLMDFTEGMMKIDGDHYADIYGEVLAGRITGYGGCGGRGDIHIDYNNVSPGHTLVWATSNPYRAWNPSPICGAEDEDPELTLSWSPGDGADLHHIFLSTNHDDVNDGNLVAWKGAQPGTTYNTGPLLLGQEYYWRIEEVDNDVPRYTAGQVWAFKVRDNVVQDDMEDYDDATNPVWDTWIDGCGDANGAGGNGSGSCVYIGTGVAVSGQSMLYYYDNSGQDIHFGTRDCNYAVATCTFDAPRDWTLYAAEALELMFYGAPDNDATALEAMYVVVSDGTKEAMVVYGSREPESLNDMKTAEWQQWDIPLSDFNGVDLTAVALMSIGFGDPTNCDREMGGYGLMYFDDIALYPYRCVPRYTPDIYDLNEDCVVDWGDAETFMDSWLEDKR